MRRGGASGAIILTTLVVAAAPAGAGEREGAIVVESYPGPRPADAAQVLEALVVELHANGFVVGDALRARVERLSRPSAPLGDAELAEIRSAIEVGWGHWTAGEYGKAVDTLSPAVAKLQTSPGVVVQQTPLRDQMHKALIGLAMAHKRLGNQDEARQHMAEVARAFPDRGVSRAQFGPEVHDFFRKTQAELAAQGAGSLRIEVDDPAAVIFLDERYEAVGSVSRSDLLPGTHRVYVRKGDSPGRVHDVTVSPSGATELRVAWQMEEALRSGPGFVGFDLADAGARERLEARVARALARLLGAPGVVVITIGPYLGRRALTASLLSVESGKPYRAAVVALEPAQPAPEALRSLVRFLLTGERGTGILIPAETRGSAAASDSRSRWYRDAWGWALAGGGLALVATGVGFIASARNLDEEGRGTADAADAKTLFDRADSRLTVGVVLSGVGALGLVAGGIKLAVVGTGAERGKAAVVLGPGWLGVAGSF